MDSDIGKEAVDWIDKTDQCQCVQRQIFTGETETIEIIEVKVQIVTTDAANES